MINDDRLVMHTSDSWEYGDDDTGDVLDCENRAGIVSRQGCQMAKFDPLLSLDCARVDGVGAQGAKGQPHKI